MLVRVVYHYGNLEGIPWVVHFLTSSQAERTLKGGAQVVPPRWGILSGLPSGFPVLHRCHHAVQPPNPSVLGEGIGQNEAAGVPVPVAKGSVTAL